MTLHTNALEQKQATLGLGQLPMEYFLRATDRKSFASALWPIYVQAFVTEQLTDLEKLQESARMEYDDNKTNAERYLDHLQFLEREIGFTMDLFRESELDLNGSIQSLLQHSRCCPKLRKIADNFELERMRIADQARQLAVLRH